MSLQPHSLSMAPRRGLVLAPDALTFVVTLRSSVVAIEGAERWLLDRTAWAVIPGGARVALRPVSPASQLMTLTVMPALVDHVLLAYAFLGVERRTFERYLGSPRLLPRTIWVYELCQRYLFEREALGRSDNEATRFLETELLKEAYYLCRDQEEGQDRAPLVQQHSALVAKAMGFIEAHLFEPESVARISRLAGASESTLLRAFKRELGATPAAYWRGRRLDEALALLRSRAGSVAEIAARVGYDNPAAFAQAFQLRFGQSPSGVLSRRPVRQAP